MAKLLGHDISEFQGVQAPGNSSFEIVKLTEGLSYANPEANAQIASALANGQDIGGYHFASPGNPVGQAKYFVSHFPKYRPFIPFVDIEGNAAIASNNPVGFALEFLTEVRKATRLTGGLYINESVLTQFNWHTVKAAGFLLWVADWNAVLPANPWNATVWQSGDGNGRLDADVFFGDRAKWAELGSPARAKHSAPTPVAKPKSVAVYYTIRANDTLDGIAARFHTSVSAITKLNRIPNINLIYTNQKIRVK